MYDESATTTFQARIDDISNYPSIWKAVTQTQMQYSDGKNGRCAFGVIMSYFGWDGTDDFDTAKVLFAAMGKLKRAGIDEELLMELKDLGMTFDEIADYLDRTDELTN